MTFADKRSKFLLKINITLIHAKTSLKISLIKFLTFKTTIPIHKMLKTNKI